ncbi:MAG: hypothetical protein IJ393_03490 [Clostridia bacterium]|nr:hypothetical protein [Clostridia bacterium]
MNLLVGFSNDFAFIKYFWLINGAALSVLWPSLIRLLSETLHKENMGRAVKSILHSVSNDSFGNEGDEGFIMRAEAANCSLKTVSLLGKDFPVIPILVQHSNTIT